VAGVASVGGIGFSNTRAKALMVVAVPLEPGSDERLFYCLKFNVAVTEKYGTADIGA
jgi:hypothetical protein